MPAAYDYYDYPSYWEGRDYEHESELHVLKDFLEKIPKINTILELGAGYGRLTPTYYYRARKVIVSDPSAKLLKKAKSRLKKYENIKYIQGNFDTVSEKVKKKVDLVILVRVLHHIEKPEECIKAINKLLKKKGYFILEFANKRHFKANLKEFLKGNFTYPIDIFTKDLSSKESSKNGGLPFYNFHPDKIYTILEENGFEIIERRSVSNVRNPHIKRLIPKSALVWLETILQKPLSRIAFGPSIFVLARKVE